MTKKPLNLSLPESLIEEIKIFAIQNGLTVSDIVENALTEILQNAKHESTEQKNGLGE